MNPKQNPIKSFILKLVRIRQRLINEGVGIRSTYDAALFISKVKNHAHCGVFDTEKGAAGFMLRNREQIHALIPGKACSANAKLEMEFQETLLAAAKHE